MFPQTDFSLLLVLLALFVFHSPFTRWWTSLGLPWYTVFLLWLGLIGLIAFNTMARGKHDGD